jgi:hypothetical protein
MSEHREYEYDDTTLVDVTFRTRGETCSTPKGEEDLTFLEIEDIKVIAWIAGFDCDVTESLKKNKMLRYFKAWAIEKYQREGLAA